MKFSIIHPTARVTTDFANPWWVAGRQALLTCDNRREVEYILVVHHSRIVEFYDTMRDVCGPLRAFARFTVVTNYGRDCLVDQCNAGHLAASGEILLSNQDDMRYPEHWDTELLKLIPDTSKAICIQARTDGARGDLLTIPTIATAALCNRIGPISPEYDGMFSDNEWSAKARQLGRVLQSKLYFQHQHPVNQAGKVDAVYLQENREEAYRIGYQTFQRRAALGFPRVELPGFAARAESQYSTKGKMDRALDWLESRLMAPAPSAPRVIESPAPRLITFCLPGETFRFEWLSGLVALCAEVGNAGFQIKLCFGYSTSCYTTRISLAQDVISAAQTVRPEFVFWLDDDNIVRPDAFLKLVSFLDTNPTADVVTGWCWIRQKDRWGISVGTKFWEDDVHLCPIELGELFADNCAHKRIAHTGFPCVLMRYEVLEKLGAHAFMPILRADLPTWFAGEDVAFSLRARDAGIQMWVDPTCKVAHLKFMSQEPDIQLYRDSPKDLVDWRAQVNGPAIMAPKNFDIVEERAVP